jgi:hypothetical protein
MVMVGHFVAMFVLFMLFMLRFWVRVRVSHMRHLIGRIGRITIHRIRLSIALSLLFFRKRVVRIAHGIAPRWIVAFHIALKLVHGLLVHPIAHYYYPA